MKTKALLSLIIFFMISCSGDKKAQLEKLKTKHDKITEQIKVLEKEIATADTTTENKNASLVGVISIQPTTFNHYVEVFGKLDGDENVAISSQAGGKVLSINAKVGEHVTKGQLLVKLDDGTLSKTIQGMEANLKMVTELYDKQKALWEQNVGSEVQYLQAKTNKEAMEANLASLREQADMFSLKSPINGTVEELTAKIGQMLSPGMVAVRVVNFASVKVLADLAESYATRINAGDKVIVSFPDLRQEVNASISFSSRYINPVNRTFSVEARLNPSIPNLKANMVAVLKINDYKADKAVVVPINLVQNDQGGTYVYIAQANSSPVAKKVKVKLGQSYNGNVEVLDGLKTGDKLITVGYQDLDDGEAIRF
jgi:membrane fusion protein, multidrug efflux system